MHATCLPWLHATIGPQVQLSTQTWTQYLYHLTRWAHHFTTKSASGNTVEILQNTLDGAIAVTLLLEVKVCIYPSLEHPVYAKVHLILKITQTCNAIKFTLI